MKPFTWNLVVAGISEALATMRSRPLRALLASLAMAAAVAATAVVQTTLDGLAREARATSARAFGSDSFVIAKVATSTLSRRELAQKLERNPHITRADVRFLDTVAGTRVMYAATSQRTADVVAGGRRFENATISGTQATLFEIRDVGVENGRPFTRTEETSAAPVIVVGRGIVDALFPAGDPLGATVRIGNRAFRIVGIQAQQGTAGGASLDRYVWMPLMAFERTFGPVGTLQVFAKAYDVSRTTAAEDRARASMRARRHLSPGAPDTFDLITPEASRGFVAAITERLGAAGPPIALMALLAAIVVVTNTTLVSVTQRTHEIGVRRALGAPRISVLLETMAESSVIAIVGGAIGVLIAAAVVAAASGRVGVPLALEWPTLAGSLAAAAVAGVAAGWYPARRAASLNVITALRQE
ncbi:MAG: ABC transporter permease [Acidobacteria bacterium]|nr:MAG: ABC transporter permease [Acidobacteriota bacterium]